MGAYYPIPSGQDRSLDTRTVEWFCKGCPYLCISGSSYGRQNATSISASGNITHQGTAGVGASVFSQETLGHHEFINTNYYCSSPGMRESQAVSQESSTLGGGGYCPFLKSKLDLMYDSISDEGGV